MIRPLHRPRPFESAHCVPASPIAPPVWDLSSALVATWAGEGLVINTRPAKPEQGEGIGVKRGMKSGGDGTGRERETGSREQGADSREREAESREAGNGSG